MRKCLTGLFVVSKVFDLIVFVHKERKISLLLIITAAVVRVFAE